MHTNRHSDGYVVLVTVIVLGAITALITSSILILGLDLSRTSLALEQSSSAKGLADACAEEALQQIRDFAPFTGTGNLIFEQGTCSYTVANTGGDQRLTTALGTVGTVVRKVKITSDAINPNINIISWQEVADF